LSIKLFGWLLFSEEHLIQYKPGKTYKEFICLSVDVPIVLTGIGLYPPLENSQKIRADISVVPNVPNSRYQSNKLSRSKSIELKSTNTKVLKIPLEPLNLSPHVTHHISVTFTGQGFTAVGKDRLGEETTIGLDEKGESSKNVKFKFAEECDCFKYLPVPVPVPIYKKYQIKGLGQIPELYYSVQGNIFSHMYSIF